MKFKQVIDVQWLSHDQAVTAIRRCLPSLLTNLEYQATENGDPTALGLFTTVKSFKFVSCLLLLSDILPQLSRISLLFQKSDIQFSVVQSVVQATIATISDLIDNPGPNMHKLDQVLSEELRCYNITYTDSEYHEFKHNITKPYITAIIANLQNHFTDVEIISTFKIFDPSCLPSVCSSEYPQYGCKDLDIIFTHFSSYFPSKESLQLEWDSFKQLLRGNYSNLTLSEVMDLLMRNHSIKQLYPILSMLACAVAVLLQIVRGLSQQ